MSAFSDRAAAFVQPVRVPQDHTPRALVVSGLLLELVDLGCLVLTRPMGDHALRRRQAGELGRRLDREQETDAAGLARFFKFAWLLVPAIDHASECRAFHDDEGAAKWESIIGALVPHVRVDAARALETMRGS